MPRSMVSTFWTTTAGTAEIEGLYPGVPLTVGRPDTGRTSSRWLGSMHRSLSTECSKLADNYVTHNGIGVWMRRCPVLPVSDRVVGKWIASMIGSSRGARIAGRLSTGSNGRAPRSESLRRPRCVGVPLAEMTNRLPSGRSSLMVSVSEDLVPYEHFGTASRSAETRNLALSPAWPASVSRGSYPAPARPRSCRCLRGCFATVSITAQRVRRDEEWERYEFTRNVHDPRGSC